MAVENEKLAAPLRAAGRESWENMNRLDTAFVGRYSTGGNWRRATN